ncbi:MAG: sialate O-acetylesterase, partial [bacterium]
GGYYNVLVNNITTGESEQTDSVSIGIVFLAAGQSNSNNGLGETKDTTQRPDFAYGYRDWWRDGWYSMKRPPVDPQNKIGGPWVFFAKYLNDSFPDVPVGFLQAAQGGSSVDAWQPGEACYKLMLENMKASRCSKFEAIVWIQGEADSKMTFLEYNQKLLKVLQSIRDTIQQPKIPFYYSQIGYGCGANNIREAQRRFTELDSLSYLAGTAMDLGADCHYPEAGCKILGGRFAAMFMQNNLGMQLNAGPPTPVAVSWEGNERNKVRVRFHVPSGTGLQTGENLSLHKGFTSRKQTEFYANPWDAGIKVNKAYVAENDSNCILLETRTFNPDDTVYIDYGEAGPYEVQDRALGMGGPNAAICFWRWKVGDSMATNSKIDPAPFSAKQNIYLYPNPFTCEITISLASIRDNAGGNGRKVNIYDVNGKRIWSRPFTSHLLTPNTCSSMGTWSCQWDGKDNNGLCLAAGAYFVRLETGNSILTRKVIVLR